MAQLLAPGSGIAFGDCHVFGKSNLIVVLTLFNSPRPSASIASQTPHIFERLSYLIESYST
jgi:hypothetical protein